MGDKDDEDLNKVVVEGGVPHACAGMSLLTIMTEIPDYGPWSPYGMASILASWKTDGPDELKEILNLKMVTISDADLFDHFKIMSNSFKSKENESNFTLKCESRMFAPDWIKIKEKFAQTVKEKFDMEIISCDFKDQKTYEAINEWSLASTDGNVDLVLPPEKLNHVELVLLNVVYFKGVFEQKFDPSKTFQGQFFLENDQNETVQVPFMKLENGQFLAGRFTSGDMEIDILSIPFKGDRLRLIIYMLEKSPIKTQFKNILEKNHNYEIFIPSLLKSEVLKEKMVNLTFPKFTCATIWPYNLPLAFTSPSEPSLSPDEFFKHVCETPPEGKRIGMTLEMQKVLVEFDEGQDKSQQQQGVKRKAEKDDGDVEVNVEFNANRPFFYAIADTKTDMMLIQGHCKNPLKTKNDIFICTIM